MENTNHLLIVFTAYVIAAGNPDPSTLRIMGVAMTHGRRAGLALAVGGISRSLFWGLRARVLDCADGPPLPARLARNRRPSGRPLRARRAAPALVTY